jgi:hypothetical protein
MAKKLSKIFTPLLFIKKQPLNGRLILCKLQKMEISGILMESMFGHLPTQQASQ